MKKLKEVVDLRNLLDDIGGKEALAENKLAAESRKTSSRIHNDTVKSRLSGIQEKRLHRNSSFGERQKQQAEKLQLPEFPTTTIGSFPMPRKFAKRDQNGKR